MNQKKIIIFTSIGLIVLFILAGYFYKNQQTTTLQKMAGEQAELFERPYSWSIGPKDAKVHLVEFMDPACETCALFHPFVKDIMMKNEGKIRLTLRYATFHDGSEEVVKMLEAARMQGKFIETLEMMFATQRYWASHHHPNPQLLMEFLPKLGLDMEKLAKDMKDPILDKMIAQDMADAKALGASKTPAYFVNGKPLQTFGHEPLKELIYSAF
ncbi:MAG: disulfide bond formation protein DsbA [Sulfurovum sp.]|nr:MAG: disulfide bond formation protein DsbA [Sulfurovum sp.]